MKPASIIFDFGDNIHGQKITAKRYTNYMGKTAWILEKQPSCQRDQRDFIDGITDEQMAMFSKAVEGIL